MPKPSYICNCDVIHEDIVNDVKSKMQPKDDYIQLASLFKLFGDCLLYTSAHGHEMEKRKALTVEQERIFLEYLRNSPRYNHWYPVFYIMANTGMRVGEITGLRWCDVEDVYKRQEIYVRHQWPEALAICKRYGRVSRDAEGFCQSGQVRRTWHYLYG